MNKRTKQILALLLAVCTLAGFAMPTVFATQGAEGDAPESVTYQFYNADWNETAVSVHTAEIKTAYDQGNANWRYEVISNPYQMRPNGGQNSFASGTSSIEIVCGAGVWFAVRIQSPGAGRYDLTYTHGAKNQGAEKGELYIVKADAIDNELGENADTYAAAMSNEPYQENGATDAYKAVVDAINTAIAGKDSVIDSNYYASSTTKGLTDTGSFVFEANTEYVLVFKSVTQASGASTARLLLTSLKADFSADQSGLELPPEPTTYQFYNADWNETAVSVHTAEIKAAYDQGNINWRYEATNNTYQMRPNGGQHSFASGTGSVEFVTTATQWVAVRIQSPGAGKFDLSYVHGAKNQGAEKGELYIVKADAIDNALGENADTYAAAMSNEPYQGNGATDAYKAVVDAINAAVAGKGSVITSNYYASSTQKNLTDTGSFTFEADTEYVLVFKSVTQASGASTARLLLTSLTATYSDDQEGGNEGPDPTDNLAVSFQNDATKAGVTTSTYFQTGSLISAFNTAYGAKSIQWAPYTGNGSAMVNSNGYAGGARLRWNSSRTTAVFEIENDVAGDVYSALKFRAPGTGLYKLSVDYTALSSADPDGTESGAYILEMPQSAYTSATLAASEAEGAAKATFTPGSIGTCDSGEETVPLVYGREYIIVFYTKADTARTRTNFSGFSLTYMAEYVPDDPIGPGGDPSGPNPPVQYYTDGLYDFYEGVNSGATLDDSSIADIAAKYDADKLNWKYETHTGINLGKTSYTGQSMRFISTVTWWIAFRLKAPAQDGSYNIQMTHGAGGQGAVSGNIYILPGDTATKDINKAMVKKGATTTTDWFYGEKSGDAISGRQSGVGTVNMEAGKEYIVVFMPTEKSAITNNAYMWLGQLQATRVGDMVEEAEDDQDTAGYYEFYHYDYPGQYLHHYKTEEELKAKIVKDVIAKEYEEGLINWKHEPSSGFANFVTGTPYMDATIGESYPFVLRIKSPGTGTYSIEYTHYTTTAKNAADHGYVYIVEVPEKEYDYTVIRDECAFKDPIITTSYKADKNGFVTVKGEYTAFKEGKEYFLCFDVADADPTKKPSIHAYPQSMQMTRTGDYKPEPGKEPDDGTVYNLMLGDEYKNKYLWHSSDPTLYNEVTKRFENGSLNWRLESIGGQAVYSAKYLKVGVSKEGGVVGIRIKSPGTGKYKVTLKYLLGNDIRDANDGEIYIVEAPEKYVDGTYLADKMARAPITTARFSHTGNGMEKATTDGTYNFEAGKEYLIILYLSDIADKGNTTKSTWAYLDRFVLKRIGEFEPEPEHFSKGGVVVKDANRLFRTSGSEAIVEINGHDYLAMAVYGGTMMLYDLDEWRLVDEVLTGVNTPRGVAVDNDGKFWITGDTKIVYCYDPYTLTGEMHKLGLPGGSAYNITCGEDGYLYWSTYASTGGYIYRMDPKTLEFTMFTYSGWSCYIADMDQKGDYIYAFVSGEERHELWKINKLSGKVVDSVDMTAEMLTTRYMDGVEFLDENYLWMATSACITIVDVRTMEKLPAEQIGIDGVITRAISGELNGKRYFISSKEGLCYYDIATQTFGACGGELSFARSALRGKDYNLATIDDTRLPGTSIITYGGMSADGLNLYAYNVENDASVTLVGLVENSFAYGQDLREMGAGLPGSGEIYYGANYEAPVQVYNCLTNEEGRAFATNGQADSFHWYKDQLYIGNYNGAVLTRMENGVPVALFRLNNDAFYQARIHSISGGDDKVFVGTVPHVYQNGGVLAWYDLNTELTYVVTGPNPEDVYYAKASKVTVTEQWYSAVTHELVDIEKEWDKDEDGDGVCKYFKGPIPLQSITKVVYRNGLIFGLSAPMGGTSAVNPVGATAKMFIYDVENMKMLKVFDIGDYISGLPYPLHAVASFEGDPEISNKFWGVVSETLFSMTYDFDTGKITIKEELSFDKTTIKNGNGWFCNDMLFQGDYIYVMLYKKGGLCRINRNNPKEYEQLLYNFESVKDMPSSFVLADDGDLYYIAGTALYVLNLDITEEERATAKSVQDAIDLIPAEVALTDRSVIEAARAAWDAMAPANQPLVKNYQKLEEAEIELLRLRIAALGEITLEDEAELVAIRKTYSTLTLEQRMSLDFLTVSRAESIMSILRGERMVKIIDAIGEVTLEKEAVIRDARAAFMALSIYERRLVTNIEVLNAAESVLNTLILRRNNAQAVDKLIEDIGFVFFYGGKISKARDAYNKLDAETKAMVEKYGTLVACEILLVAEYVIVAAGAVCGVLYAIPTTRAKIFKKKEEVTEE